MAEPIPEEGTYCLINVRRDRHALDTRGEEVVVTPYIGSTTQQWNLTTQDGVGWHIQNVESSNYLGLPANEHVRNGLHVREVRHKFVWQLKKGKDVNNHNPCFHLYVPYTKHVIDLNPIENPTGISPYVYDEGKGPHQAWYLCKDLHLRTPSALANGKIYKIVNAVSQRAITLEDDGSVACHQSSTRSGQEFQAIGTDQTWVFKSVWTGRYLGLPLNHFPLIQNSPSQPKPCLGTVEREFTWIVLPHYHAVLPKFKLWIPFTAKVLSMPLSVLAGSQPVHIGSDGDGEEFWWRFEEAAGSD